MVGVLVFGNEALAVAKHKLGSLFANHSSAHAVVVIGFGVFAAGAIWVSAHG